MDLYTHLHSRIDHPGAECNAQATVCLKLTMRPDGEAMAESEAGAPQ